MAESQITLLVITWGRVLNTSTISELFVPKQEKKKKKSLLKVRNELLVVEFMIALKVLEAKCSPSAPEITYY